MATDGFYLTSDPLGAKCDKKETTNMAIGRTLRPIVTGSSVLGITFSDGVMLAADTLGSYGSLARYRDLSRLLKVNDTTVAAGSGDYADFQYIARLFESLNIESDSYCDGHSYTPRSFYSWLTRVMYNRRTKINPLWNTVIMGGYHDNKPFLGVVNSLGVSFEAPTLATGFGGYIAQPLMRDAYEKNPSMSKEEAQKLLEKCMTVLYYRDARSWNKYEIATITTDGVTITGPMKLEGNWEVANYVRGYD
ncbi:PREDICTED: proteasome subunit beta type-4-like [Amphimedon queenslandica]|uniref:Proteasome subunit beta n=1 Tax=Amphimedon queenslandica TaxID=400682 RepID=A0A1X7VF19_AMPQE|nr:PREDICTED: proteasome subunit beta type-4-like [Amphimedon queenslandica]|eukprot:XP_003384464.1 PREDICTED: proteasome subunit beta type-4-like [Amphimedon queenslandica]